MEASSPVPRQSVGRTFTVAIAILGVVAAVQLIAVFYVFMSRYRANVDLESLDVPLAAVPGESEEVLVDGRPIPSAEEAPSAMAKPTPISAAAAGASTESRLVEMIQQARALRERGDVVTALTRLREALAISPNSALIISELALTFEKLGQPDKALEQWRKLYEMGESAGIYYSAAEAKLRATETAADASDGTGLQPGSVLGLMDIEKRDGAGEGGETKFSLRIPLKAKANMPVDVRDVVIQVYFYDLIGGQDVVQTNATVSSFWSTLPPDWSDDDIEVLEVEYLQPAMAKGETIPETEARKFYGYIVRIYYRNELQDMRAEPVSLLKKYPPPLTLQTE